MSILHQTESSGSKDHNNFQNSRHSKKRANCTCSVVDLLDLLIGSKDSNSSSKNSNSSSNSK